MSDIRSIALIDLSYLFAKSWHGQPRDAMPGHAAQVTMELLAAVRESVDHTIVCLDAPPYWRKEIYPEYKGQRERPSDEELAQKKWVLEQIEKDGYRVAKVQGFEADDLCATLAKDYGCWCPDVRIVSADKDCAQCVNDRVRMFVPAVGGRHAEIRGPAEVVAKFGVRPKDMALLLALCGDKSDNLPGVPKVGAKTAAGWINEFGDAGSIASMSCQVVGAGGKIPATVQSLYDCVGKLGLWLKLTTLRTDVPIDADALLARGETKPLVTEDHMGDMAEDLDRCGHTDEPMARPQRLTGMRGGTVPTEAEFDPISKAPEGYIAPPLQAPKAEPVQTTALAKAQSTVTEDLQPLDINSAARLARALFDGKMYSKYPNEQAVFTIILKARELGLKVTTALDCFSVIKGVPRASADLIQALCERDPDCEYFKLVESTPERAVYRIKRKSHAEPFPDFVYTMEDARTAGLATNDNYRKNPAAMLRARCKSTGGRAAFPGAACGLYCPEEMGD